MPVAFEMFFPRPNKRKNMNHKLHHINHRITKPRSGDAVNAVGKATIATSRQYHPNPFPVRFQITLIATHR
jgi:hypothetical protein